MVSIYMIHKDENLHTNFKTMFTCAFNLDSNNLQMLLASMKKCALLFKLNCFFNLKIVTK